MSQSGPIVLIDDDEDDYELFTMVMEKEGIQNKLIHFTNGAKALEYLQTTTDSPFLILSDMNMPKMGGIELRQAIEKDERLRRKSVPFIFFTTSGAELAVRRAYDLSVQGFFVKRDTVDALIRQVRLIFDYWQECYHPNNFPS